MELYNLMIGCSISAEKCQLPPFLALCVCQLTGLFLAKIVGIYAECSGLCIFFPGIKKIKPITENIVVMSK